MWVLFILAFFAVVQGQLTDTYRDEPVPAVEPRIINGFQAPDGVFLWQASLRDKTNNQHFCGGTVIGKKWILTSARCATMIDASDMQVVVGSHKLSSGGTAYKVNSIIVHKNFTQRPLHNDIGLISTDEIKFNNKVKAIELDDGFVGANEKCLITGWGYDEPYRASVPDYLQMMQVTIISDKTCKTRFRRKNTFQDGYNMCSMGQDQGTCKGDEGGPVTRGDKLVGVVSFAFNCNIGYPDVHTRVSAYINWIREHAKE